MKFWKKSTDPLVQKGYRKRLLFLFFLIIAALVVLFFFQTPQKKSSFKSSTYNTLKQQEDLLVDNILNGNTTHNVVSSLNRSVSQNKEKIAIIEQKLQDLMVQNTQQKNTIDTLRKQESGHIDTINQLQQQLKKRIFVSPKAKNKTFSKYQILQLPLIRSKKQGASIKTYIPAGSYVPAVVISGADANVGVNVSDEVKPVLLRITGLAQTAAKSGQRPYTIDLRGCLITGEARGSLSSEKVYIRTAELSCSFSEGRVSEYKMVGYVAGTGKAGVRGPVISREGDLVEKSFLAGLAGGLGAGSMAAFTPSTIQQAGGGTIPAPLTPSKKLLDALGLGFGQGIKNAADRISAYFIKRAEMYQPVISLQAGTKVEVVFMQGLSLVGQKKTTLE